MCHLARLFFWSDSQKYDTLFLAHVSLALFMSCVYQVFSPWGQGYTGNLWTIFNSYKHESSKKAATKWHYKMI